MWRSSDRKPGSGSQFEPEVPLCGDRLCVQGFALGTKQISATSRLSSFLTVRVKKGVEKKDMLLSPSLLIFFFLH